MSHRDENTESKVYVGDLPKDAEEKELERAFSYYGRIKSVWLARNPPGFAFIEYEDPKDAEDAVRGLDGNTICGVKARVEHATGKKRQKPWQGGGGGGGRGGGWGADRYGGGGGGGARRGFDPDDRCFQCGERGHHSRDCHQKRGGGGGYDRGRDDRGSARRRRSPSRSRSRERSPARRRSPSRSPSRSRSRERARD